MPISDPDEPEQTWDEPKIKCRPGQAKVGPTDPSGPAMSNPEQTQQFQLSQAQLVQRGIWTRPESQITFKESLKLALDQSSLSLFWFDIV